MSYCNEKAYFWNFFIPEALIVIEKTQIICIILIDITKKDELYEISGRYF